MKIALIAVTEQGRRLSKRLAEELTGRLVGGFGKEFTGRPERWLAGEYADRSGGWSGGERTGQSEEETADKLDDRYGDVEGLNGGLADGVEAASAASGDSKVYPKLNGGSTDKAADASHKRDYPQDYLELNGKPVDSGTDVVVRYCFYKHSDDRAVAYTGIGEITAKLFTESDALIFICACGIAVRAIAPHVRSKLTDPAVVVLDDMGRWAIPVLSGHIGGANRLALRIAAAVGAEAVISTATDARGRFSPDLFAMDNDLIILDMEAARHAAAASANGEPVYFYCEYEHEEVPEGLICVDDREQLKVSGSEGNAIIYVGNCCLEEAVIKNPDCSDSFCRAIPGSECAMAPRNVCVMVPRNVVLGIGCRKGVSCENIERAVGAAMARKGIPLKRIAGAASICIKKDEKGLNEFCRRRGLALNTFSARELNLVEERFGMEWDFHGSDFVKSITGTDSVCERSAVMLSGGGRLVVPKFIGDGVTVAAAERNVFVRFGARARDY